MLQNSTAAHSMESLHDATPPTDATASTQDAASGPSSGATRASPSAVVMRFSAPTPPSTIVAASSSLHAVDPLTLPSASPSSMESANKKAHHSSRTRSPATTTANYVENAKDTAAAAGGRLRDSVKRSASPSQGPPNHGDAAAHTKEYLSPAIPVMVIALLAFTSLVQGFSGSAVSLFMNLVLKLGPVEQVRFWMYIGFTAWCQPAIGYLSDAMVLCGEKRRPLFVLAAIGNTCIFCTLCFSSAATSTYRAFVVISVVSQFCTMGLYIPLNGLVVEVGRHDAETEEESMARMSAIMSKTMVWRSIGGLAGAVLQLFMVKLFSVRALLGITGLLFFILVPIVLITPRSLFVRSTTQDQNFYRRVAEASRLVWQSFDIHDIRSDGFCFIIVLVFVFLYTMMPDASSVYSTYLYAAFTFPTWFYSLNMCIGYLGSIAGAYIFSLWMDHRARQEAAGGRRTSMFFIFMIGSFAWAFGYVTNMLLCTGIITETVGVPAHIYIPIDTFFVSMFVRFAFMPTLTMAAEHAPKFFEATTFEVFSVASIGGGTLSSLITSNIAEGLHITRKDFSRLWLLIVISIVFKLLPVPMAYLLPEKRAHPHEAEDVIVDDGAAANAASADAPGAAAETNAAGLNQRFVAVNQYLQRESSRISQDSDDMYDPSMPLTQAHRD